MKQEGNMGQHHLTAVILAAGQAKRMGQTKQLLPWGNRTVLGQTIQHVQQSDVDDILVITGHEAEGVTAVAQAARIPTRFNPDYATGEMLSSLKTAVAHLQGHTDGVLVMLADQPMVLPDTLNQIIAPFRQGISQLIAPVRNGRRGNPVLIGSQFFDELLALPTDDAPRTLLKRHADQLHLVEVGTDSILRDLDDPAAYERWRPK